MRTYGPKGCRAPEPSIPKTSKPSLLRSGSCRDTAALQQHIRMYASGGAPHFQIRLLPVTAERQPPKHPSLPGNRTAGDSAEHLKHSARARYFSVVEGLHSGQRCLAARQGVVDKLSDLGSRGAGAVGIGQALHLQLDRD